MIVKTISIVFDRIIVMTRQEKGILLVEAKTLGRELTVCLIAQYKSKL